MPDLPAPKGWRWVPLPEIARLESGHTPSRRHPEYWNGDIPWIGIKDARQGHGKTLNETLQMVTEAGLENSAARLLPADTVCLSRTASVGYCTIMGRPMATSQDFVNWVCSDAIDPKFLQQLFLAEKDSLLEFGKGTTHKTIYYPEVKAFHVCLPPLDEQRRIVSKIESLFARSRRAKEALDAIPPLLDRLRQSILAAAFRGDLTADWRAQNPDVEPADKLLERIPTPKRPARFKSRSTRVEAGLSALSLGTPDVQPPENWCWALLLDVASLGSGHTPSRRHPEYWDGDIPWVSIPDARDNHGGTILETTSRITPAGLENSAARMLAKNSVLLCRTAASIGYVVKLGASMATSQDMVSWTCTEALEPDLLLRLLEAEKPSLLRFSKGSAHKTVYFPEILSFNVCLPPVAEQREILRRIEERLRMLERLRAKVTSLRARLAELEPSILASAFSGQLIHESGINSGARQQMFDF
ncbi:MAG: restriction endonuclease subunit S [Nannocystaceae bacterium]|nr:restriction endonuclease subunit S [bacterium]